MKLIGSNVRKIHYVNKSKDEPETKNENEEEKTEEPIVA